MINVFIACGAGASSTFLAMKLRSFSLQNSQDLKFVPCALANVTATADDIVLVASHIAQDSLVAKLSKSGTTVISLPEHINGGFRAEEAMELVLGHLNRHKN